MLITTNRLIAGLFTILLIAAAVFSLERVLFADASFILFRLINEGSLQIQEHRYGSFLTQSIPLLAAHLHLPLQMIVFLYSISFNLLYLAVALLLLYWFKERNLAVLMGLYYTLFVSDTFFWMNNEVHQGIAWMFLFFATTLAMGRKKTPTLTFLPAFTILAFLTLFTHPLLLFPASFLWLFLIGRKDWPCSRQKTILFSFILTALAFLKLGLSTGATSHYDAEKLQSIRQLSLESIQNGFRSPFAIELVERAGWNYWIVPFLFFAGCTAAWKEKALWPLLLTIGFTTFYFVALCATFNDFLPFYTESELMPWTILLTTLFVYYSLPKMRQNRTIILLSAIFFVRLIYIGYASPSWTERKNWITSALDKMRKQHITKATIAETPKNKNILQMTWGTPVESMMASALKGDSPQLTFTVDNPVNLNTRVPTDSRYMIGCFEELHHSSLNKTYFSFDTTAAYQALRME